MFNIWDQSKSYILHSSVLTTYFALRKVNEVILKNFKEIKLACKLNRPSCAII